MNEVPGPLTPANCDLRGMSFMKVDIMRMLDSDLYALSTGDEFKAAFTLLARSFLQVPAASLPDDDRILAFLSGAKTMWRKVKEMALHGWIRCSDGRLYHPVLAEKAREAWQGRVAMRQRTEAARAARAAQRRATTSQPALLFEELNGYDHHCADARETGQHVDFVQSEGSVTEPKSSVTEHRESQRERERIDKEPSLRSGTSSPEGNDAPREEGIRQKLFREGTPIIRRLTGLDERRSRQLVGGLLKQTGDNCPIVWNAISSADELCPADPVGWLYAAAKPKKKRGLDMAALRRHFGCEDVVLPP